jgi:hypothetical protein
VAVSLTLVIIATVYPPWAVVVMTVPLGAIVAIYLAHGVWRGICTRLGLAILCLAVGAVATDTITHSYGAIAAVLPCTLASLLFSVCSAIPARDTSTLLVACATATLCVGVAALVTIVVGLDSLFFPLYSAGRSADALTFVALVVGAPGLILLVRLAVPWTGNTAAMADSAAGAALFAGLLAAFLFGHVPDPSPGSVLMEVAANGSAAVLLVRATILGARAATKLG